MGIVERLKTRKWLRWLAYVATIVMVSVIVVKCVPSTELDAARAVLVGLPTGSGPYPINPSLIEAVKVSLRRASDPMAEMQGINYLWRVRASDRSIEPFLDEYSNRRAPRVQEFYGMLKRENQQGSAGK